MVGRIARTGPTKSIALVMVTIWLYFMYAEDDIDLSRTLLERNRHNTVVPTMYRFIATLDAV